MYAALLGVADLLALVCIGVLLPDRLERVSMRVAALAIVVAAVCVGLAVAHEVSHDPGVTEHPADG